jgi:excinuclease ABC subunit C
MNLKEKVKNLPSTPGVYLMKDSLAGIIYVGKAKNLKNRVGSYFQNSAAHSKKIIRLKANIQEFDYILTDTEFEAFMLECKLIREIKPIFNKKMKSPQTYPYIRIHMAGPYLPIEITNRPKLDGCLYFGPYTSKHTVDRALQGIKEFHKIICSNPTKKNTPCLNYSLGLCLGMCLGGSKLEQYNVIINKIIALLNGTDISILEEMGQRMEAASENFEFETAAKYRDYLDAIHSLVNKEKVIEFTEMHKNIAVIEYLTDCTFKLFLIKGNKILFSEKYKLENQMVDQVCAAIQTNILTYFKTKVLPPSIKVNRDEIDEAQIIYSYLKGSNCRNLVISEEWLDPVNKEYLHVELYKLVYKQKQTC